VEQMHKIFKLCGSPTEEYWKKSKLPGATIFKTQLPYKRRIRDTFEDFPQSALQLIEILLAINPADRLTATSALRSDVSWLPFLPILSPIDGTKKFKFFICVKVITNLHEHNT
jgi:serine/threonine protein kinase